MKKELMHYFIKPIPFLLTSVFIFRSVLPFTYTDKTFLLPRSHGANMAIEHSIWHSQITNDVGNKHGLTLQASPFYSYSQNKKSIGKYFGVKRRNVITIAPAELDPDAADFPAESIVHDPFNEPTIDAKLTLKPSQEAFGVFLSLYYDFKELTNGAWFTLTVPIIDVTNDINLKATGDIEQAGFTVKDYFKGKLKQTEEEQMQAPLKFGKIKKSSSTTDVADILATLGYNFFEGENHYLGFSFGVSIPTGTKPKSKKLFEAVVGNGAFFGLRFGVEGAINLWHCNNTIIELSSRIVLTTLFSETQKRIPGLLSQDGRRIPWGHYRLGGEVDQNGVFPLANVLRQKMSVCPGNQCEVLSFIAIHWNSFTWTLGSNLYAHEAEKVRLKKCEFQENTYGLTVRDYDTSVTYQETRLPDGETLITREMLDTQAAETPAQMSAKIYISFHYAEQKSRTPFFVGMGGGYEFVGDNTLLETGSIWGTLGISF